MGRIMFNKLKYVGHVGVIAGQILMSFGAIFVLNNSYIELLIYSWNVPCMMSVRAFAKKNQSNIGKLQELLLHIC